MENRYWSKHTLHEFRGEWAEEPAFKRLWDNLSAFRKDNAIRNEWAFPPRLGTVRAE